MSFRSRNKAFQYSKADLAQLFASAPPADILLTHGPVETMGPVLNWAVLNRPLVCVSGHVHEEHGAGLPSGGISRMSRVTSQPPRHSQRPRQPELSREVDQCINRRGCLLQNAKSRAGRGSSGSRWLRGAYQFCRKAGPLP